MHRQQLRLCRWRRPIQQGSGKHHRALFCPQHHRAPVDALVTGGAGAFSVFKLDMVWLKVPVRNLTQETQHNAGRTFQIMANRMTEPGQDRLVALHTQLQLHGVGHQPAITQGPLQAGTKGRATEKQILQNLTPPGRQHTADAQPDIRIATDLFRRVPESSLGRIDTTLRLIRRLIRHANTGKDGSTIQARLAHGLVGHPQKSPIIAGGYVAHGSEYTGTRAGRHATTTSTPFFVGA